MSTGGEDADAGGFAPERLAAPLLRRFYAYWDDKRGGRSMPSPADLDPLEFAWALGRITLVDVLREPLRFRYRLVGGEHANRLGADMTGKLVDEFPSPAIRHILTRSYSAAVASGRPVHRTRWDVVAGVTHHYEALILPLAADPPAVDSLAICAEYIDRDNLVRRSPA